MQGSRNTRNVPFGNDLLPTHTWPGSSASRGQPSTLRQKKHATLALAPFQHMSIRSASPSARRLLTLKYSTTLCPAPVSNGTRKPLVLICSTSSICLKYMRRTYDMPPGIAAAVVCRMQKSGNQLLSDLMNLGPRSLMHPCNPNNFRD